MTTITDTNLDIRPTTALIGAEIAGLDLSQPLDEATVAEIYAALLQWKVVFFRDQVLDEEQQIAFGRNFGDLTPAHPVQGALEGYPEVYSLDSRQLKEHYRTAGERRVGGETGWHTDITFVANPAKASILRGVVIPPYGGDTLWTNLVAAYENLSAPIRDLADHLQAVHQWHNYDRPDTDTTQADTRPTPAAIHPVVRVHPDTGERALFVNPLFTSHLVGVSARESRQLLELFFHQIGRPELSVRFRWEPNSIAFWDNRATAHVGPVDLAYADFDRVVRRVTITGDLPVGPDGFQSRPIEGTLFT
jgi:alpha-ketoglutarate-dependent sulfate ester dioxygenase